MRIGQRWQYDQAGYYREILKQQHAHGLSAGTRVKLEAVGKHLGDNGSGRHGDGESHGQGGTPVLAVGKRGDQQGANRRQQHLCAAQAEDQRAHGDQPRQAEFQTDGKHQEDHAELGKGRYLIVFSENGAAVRTEGNADRQIGQDAGDAEVAQQRHGDNSGGQKDQERKQGGMHRQGRQRGGC